MSGGGFFFGVDTREGIETPGRGKERKEKREWRGNGKGPGGRMESR